MWYLVPGRSFYTAATDQNNRVLLKVVALTRDIACYFDTVGKTNSGDLSKSGVRLLRGCSLNSCTNASLLRSGNVCCLSSVRELYPF